MRKILIPLVATALTVAMLPLKTRTDDSLVLGRTPEIVMRDLAGFRSEDLDGENTRKLLDAHAVYVRRYTDEASGRTFVVSAVVSGASRRSIHRPEYCLNCQRFVVADARTESVGGTDWRRCRVVRAEGSPTAFAFRYFNHDGFKTASQTVRLLLDMWDRAIRGRIDRWVLVTVFASTDDDAAMTEFLGKLATAR